MTLDRTRKPEVTAIDALHYPDVPLCTLQNGIPLYVIDMGDQEVNRIDLIFTAGQYDQEKKLAARTTGLMLKEGAGGLTSKAIAEQLDYYGAWLQPVVTRHNSYVTLYSLNKFFEPSLAVLEKMIRQPEFPTHEFEIIVDRMLQQHRIDENKVQVLALNAHNAQIYGTHPYGQVAGETDYRALTPDDLRRFHAQYYQPQFCRIVLTGRISAAMIDTVRRVFGTAAWQNSGQYVENARYPVPAGPKECFVEKEDALQSAVRMGIPLSVDRTHPDFIGIRVLNTVLGGYFGSRLMSNIREEKGYTYGIGSSVAGWKYSTVLHIASQTGVAFTRPLIDEVFHEIERLKNELVPHDELERVKNYMQGELVRLIDGPFAVADSYQTLLVNQLPHDYFERQFRAIRDMTPQRICELARQYLKEDDCYIAVAGKRA